MHGGDPGTGGPGLQGGRVVVIGGLVTGGFVEEHGRGVVVERGTPGTTGPQGGRVSGNLVVVTIGGVVVGGGGVGGGGGGFVGFIDGGDGSGVAGGGGGGACVGLGGGRKFGGLVWKWICI